MHPNNAKSFPAATVPAAAKLGYRRGKRGTRGEESRIARRSHVSKQNSRLWRSRGVVGVLHPPHRKNQGGNLGRNLELSERRMSLARKMRRGKQAMRKAARMKHQAAREKRRMQELLRRDGGKQRPESLPRRHHYEACYTLTMAESSRTHLRSSGR